MRVLIACFDMEGTEMRRFLKGLAAAFLCAMLMLSTFAFSGCGEAENQTKKLSVITTVFPVYDWTKNVLGENLENTDLTMLLDSGVDLHSFQPSASDLVKISSCDVFIYVGGESDEWVEKALESVKNKKIITVNLMNLLGDMALEEEEVEGMQSHGEEEEEDAYDEHIWLSLKNASFLVYEIAKGLSKADPANQVAYVANAESYQKSLDKVQNAYTEEFKNYDDVCMLFADRFPFLYLTKDFGFKYYAAFKGCSAESEASFETIAFLAGKVNELGLKNIFVLEGSDEKIAKTVLETAKSDAKILKLNSMQTTIKKDVEEGASYYDIMKQNLETIANSLR